MTRIVSGEAQVHSSRFACWWGGWGLGGGGTGGEPRWNRQLSISSGVKNNVIAGLRQGKTPTPIGTGQRDVE